MGMAQFVQFAICTFRVSENFIPSYPEILGQVHIDAYLIIQSDD